jgi:Flp pilus assembly protein TadG
MILILPVFLGIIFTIMEIGYVSFQLILLNHATFEAARVGGMTYYPSKNTARAGQIMQKVLANATVSCEPETTLQDPQTVPPLQNMDLVCTGTENVHLIFPISSIILAKPAGSGTRMLTATVRMPIEQPLPN